MQAQRGHTSRWLLLLVINLCCWVNFAGAADVQESAAAVLKKSAEHVQGALGWQLRFRVEYYAGGQEKTGGYHGDLLLGQGDQFRLTIPGQTYLSDGVTLWQYSQTQSQVLIKNVADMQGSMHPSEALFRYLRCQPLTVHQQTVQGIQVYELTLDPSQQMEGYQSLVVWLNAQTYEPYRLEMVDGTGTKVIYYILNLQKNPEFSQQTFHFESSSDIDEIDMR